MKNEVSILKMASISAAGSSQKEIWDSYVNGEAKFSEFLDKDTKTSAGLLCHKSQAIINEIREENEIYKNLDDSVLYALLVSRQVLDKNDKDKMIGVNFGSSRGATKSLEHHHSFFKDNGHCNSLASPSSTLGNISSWVAHDLGIDGPTISHSITCSTALHSLLNGVAWLQSGMSEKFIVGGSESAVTSVSYTHLTLPTTPYV